MEKYIRNCPKCNKEIEYKNKNCLNVALKNNKPCSSCAAILRLKKYGKNQKFVDRYATKGKNIGKNNAFYGKTHTKETKQKLAVVDKGYTQTQEFRDKSKLIGKNNGMYGKSVYDVWIGRYGKEEADKKLNDLREKHKINSAGKNNSMYSKPTPQGSGNGWSGWYNSFYFRSLRELSYIVNLDKQNKKWSSAEKIRIPYVNWDGKERTYAPDFLVEDKILVEIKPTKLRETKSVQLKKEAAEKYCKDKNLEYLLVDAEPLSTEEIKTLRSSGKVKFLERYERKFIERYE